MGEAQKTSLSWSSGSVLSTVITSFKPTALHVHHQQAPFIVIGKKRWFNLRGIRSLEWLQWLQLLGIWPCWSAIPTGCDGVKGNSKGRFERHDLPLNPQMSECGLCICWMDESVRTRGHTPARHLGWWANNFYDAPLSCSDCAIDKEDVHYVTLSAKSQTEGLNCATSFNFMLSAQKFN